MSKRPRPKPAAAAKKARPKPKPKSAEAAPPAEAPSPPPRGLDLAAANDAYERFREDRARRSREASLAGRDIGEPPRVEDWDRRRRASRLLRRFCETYGGEVFRKRWSRDHRRTLVRLQQVVTRGGQFALAMPRGSGKTSW